ncbi:hypothetical protein [Marinobacter shengliensis]
MIQTARHHPCPMFLFPGAKPWCRTQRLMTTETVMFEKNTLLRALLAAGLTTGLAACGGGDSDGGSALPPEADFVSGEFKDARIEGKAYPSNLLYAAGNTGRQCEGQTHYFETEDGRIRVYGSTALSETNFRVVATMIDQRLDKVMNAFGMSWDEFVDQRPYFTLDHLSTMVREHQLWQEIIAQPDHYQDPTASATSEMISESAAAWDSWSSLTLDEQKALVDQSYVQAPLADTLLPREALVTCLVSGTGGSTVAEGSQFGIQVPGETSTYHSKIGEIFTHEIVHFVQNNITHVGQDNPYSVMPRWFSEGQAAFMAGQSVASPDHHHNFDPVNIITFDDEIETRYDSGFTYEHYALAYKYLDENNGRDTVVDMMLAMKSNTDAPHEWQSKEATAHPPLLKDEGLSFSRAFANYLKDHEGQVLTIDRYRESYHQLLGDWK